MYTQHLEGWKINQELGVLMCQGILLVLSFAPHHLLAFHFPPIHHELGSPEDNRSSCLCLEAGRSFWQEVPGQEHPSEVHPHYRSGNEGKKPQSCPANTGIPFSFALLPKNKKSQREVTDHGRDVSSGLMVSLEGPTDGQLHQSGSSTTHHGQSCLGGSTAKTPEPHRHSLRMLENLHMLAH